MRSPQGEDEHFITEECEILISQSHQDVTLLGCPMLLNTAINVQLPQMTITRANRSDKIWQLTNFVTHFLTRIVTALMHFQGKRI